MRPVLYILMRDDMKSLNAGKGMAQASHATSAFMKRMSKSDILDTDRALYNVWSTDTNQGFGTVIVKAGDIQQIDEAVRDIGDRWLRETVLDPTYPVRDGQVTHLIPVVTCAYVFGDADDQDLRIALAGLKLHP